MKCKIKILLWAMSMSMSMSIMTSDSESKSDSLLLNCGSTSEEAVDSEGRKWRPDWAFLSRNESSTATAETQHPSLPSTVPYMQSRIFKSQTTYKFPISPESRHLIRLHFYPSSYGHLDSSAAFFSVSAARFTLLRNFSASLTAQPYIIREFSIPKLNSGTLHLTFTPTTWAFINGIEIISVREMFQHNVDAMQTMYRLNVGGQFIAASQDSPGTWYDDSPHIYGAAYGVTSRAASDVAIAYPSRLAAPSDVYATARTMGPNSNLNLNYNLTWIFDVDANFTYLLRLHFCDFLFHKVNQVVFLIFINNRTAETDADVVGWGGGRGVPVYKDYEVHVGAHVNHLWLALHPNKESKPQYYDSILNGIELFKLNDAKGNLAGPNPIPSLEKVSHNATTTSPSKESTKIVLACVGVVGVIIGIIACSKQKGTAISWSSSSSRMSSLEKGLCRQFSIGEIRAATKGFSESCVVGVGGFGKVYRGCIDGNATQVAVKRANPSSQQGLHEFLNEIQLLSKLRHRHLVSLIGACEEKNEMVLVYDYMANGTLREHLYSSRGKQQLSWKQRLDICIGAARGIHYLHTGAKHPIIHRDVKTTNILLDEKWVAKVSDFGLSKTRHALEEAHVSTAVKGSFGYLDPEYYRLQQLTDKSDVYSFGVVLLEVLCARPPIDPTLSTDQLCLADSALRSYRKAALHEIIDPNIKDEINQDCLKHYTQTALKCLCDDSVDRPSMAQVLRNLEHCLKLQSHQTKQHSDSVNHGAFADVFDETQGR